MVLKDWKKVGKDKWKKRDRIMEIREYHHVGHSAWYEVWTKYARISPQFTNKDNALKSAKQYMKTH